MQDTHLKTGDKEVALKIFIRISDELFACRRTCALLLDVSVLVA